MNENITKTEQTIRGLQLRFESNIEYLHFIKVLALSSGLHISKIGRDLFEQEMNTIMEDPKLQDLYQKIVID